MDTKTSGQKISALIKGRFLNLGKVMPAGSLEARKLSSGAVQFYWRFTSSGETKREAIGLYDSSAPPKSLQASSKGYSIAAAVRAAESLATEHHANLEEGGFSAVKAAKEQAKTKAFEAKIEAEQYTLASLLDDYSNHLQNINRISHTEARNICNLHVKKAWPQIASLPANKVTSEQIADMMRHVIEQGKDRTANKLRSYIHAAYQVAKSARSKASIPLHFKAYKVTYNPVSDTEPDESANKADKNPLSMDELKAYWLGIKDLDGIRGGVLRLHLLTGGQRIQQLVRLQTSEIKKDRITLFDGKGRPGKPVRSHVVPLLPEAAAALLECKPIGFFAVSTDNGASHLAGTTLSGWACQIAQAHGIENFKTKRIRSGVETLLASARVNSDIRGRLQSHGVSGVQARHYDGHDYFDEKLEALKTLKKKLEIDS